MNNKNLINNLIKDKSLKTKRIIKSFFKIDRKDFVPEEFKEEAYVDAPIPIGHGVTTSQPATIAFMLEKLQPKAGDKILEIGTGSGYVTALLANIIGNKGKIFSIEYLPEIKIFAQNNLKKYNFSNIELYVGDGKQGLSEKSPFDGIISSASAVEVPEAWEDQLAISGRTITPVGSDLILITKISENDFKTETFPHFSFVELK